MATIGEEVWKAMSLYPILIAFGFHIHRLWLAALRRYLHDRLAVIRNKDDDAAFVPCSSDDAS